MINDLYIRYRDYYYDEEKLNRFGYSTSKKGISKHIKRHSKKTWGGSCFGMTTSVALNRLGIINVRKYSNSNGSGYQLNKVSYPKNNSRVKSVINYYQILSPFYILDNREFYYKTQISKWKTGLKDAVNTAKKNQLQSFNFYSDKSGHSILIKTYDKIVKVKGKKYYRLSIYDPSYPKGKNYIYIATDYKTLFITNYEKWNIYSVDVLSNFSEYRYVSIDK